MKGFGMCVASADGRQKKRTEEPRFCRTADRGAHLDGSGATFVSSGVRVSDHPQLSAKDRRARQLSKCNSLLGSAPLGLFLVLHVTLHTVPSFGGAAKPAVLSALSSSPVWLGFELATLWLPLGINAVLCLMLTFEEAPPPAPGHLARAALRHAGALVSLVFLAYYFTQFRIPLALGQLLPVDLAQELCARLSSTTEGGLPLSAALYLLGLGGLSFRFGSELTAYRAACRPQAAGAHGLWIPSLISGVLFAVNAETVVYYATGSRFLFFG